MSSSKATVPPAPPPARSQNAPPIGPSSALLSSTDTAAFAQQTVELYKRASDKQAELAQLLTLRESLREGGGDEVEQDVGEDLRARYSVQDLLDETTRFASDHELRLALRTAVTKRWIPYDPVPRPGRKRQKRETTAEADEGEDKGEGDSDARSQSGAPEATAEETVEAWEAVAKLVDGVKQSKLSILQPPASVTHFMYKTKKPDYNSLSSMRAAELPPDHLPTPPDAPLTSDDPLSNLVYILLFHPIPSRTSFGGRTVNNTKFWQTSQRQVLVCLGSTTLAEVARELHTAKEGVPKEDEEVKATGKRRRVRYGASDEDDEEEEENEEEKEAGMQVEQAPGQLPMGAQADSTGRFGGNQKVEEERERRWKREKRVTGSVFAVEDVLYADGELGEGEKEDYAQMVLDLIEETDWKRRKKAGRPNSAPDPEPDLEEDDNEPSTTASASVALNKPQLRKGRSTQETKLGELELVRTGHPYWFLTEGNVEIVWSIEEIRYRHTLDPAPTLPAPSSYPYALTTYLSQPTVSSSTALTATSTAAVVALCRICAKDPAAFVLLNDELVGESPVQVCEVCLEALHPRREEGGEVEDDEEEDEDDEEAGELERGRRFMRQGEEGKTRVRIIPLVE